MTRDELEATLLQDIEEGCGRVRRLLDDLQSHVADAQVWVSSAHFGSSGLETIRGVERAQALFLKAAGLNAAATDVGGLVETLGLLRQLEPTKEESGAEAPARLSL